MNKKLAILVTAIILSGCGSVIKGPSLSEIEEPMESVKDNISNKTAIGDYDLGEVYYQSNNAEDNEKAMDFFLWSAERGNKYAQYKLGKIYLHGEGVTANLVQAISWLKMAAAQDLVIAQLEIGDLYYNGNAKLGLERNLQKAKKWYLDAANQGNVPAMVRAANTFNKLKEVPNSKKQAFDWYLRASSFGSAEAKFRVAHLYITGIKGVQERDLKNAMKFYQEAAADGYDDALAAVGELYMQGLGVEKNLNRAQELFLSAAERGSAKGAYDLATMYDIGFGVEPDNKRAFNWYKEAAEKGYPYAAYKLGDMYMLAHGTKQDIYAANKMYMLAASKGMLQAKLRLADHYLQGLGLKANVQKAFDLYKGAATKDPYAAYMLSIMYENAYGVKQDFDKSVFWYQKAESLSGNAIAKYSVSKNYKMGRGLPLDNSNSILWLEDSAKEGYGKAQVDYAKILLAKNDIKGAFNWFVKASEQNYVEGNYNLALMYFNGTEVEQNYSKAAELFTIAAKQGLNAAQYQLSHMYQIGLGLPQNLSAAYAWWDISAKDKFENIDDLRLAKFQVLQPEEKDLALKLSKQLAKLYN